jgi:hypothetical protein
MLNRTARPADAGSMDGRPHHLIVSHAAPDAYAPMTRAILAKLGYAILMPDEYESLGAARGVQPPILRIVDERQLAEVPEDSVPLPLIVLTGRHGVTGADSRIVGAVRRPAGMHELFRLIQQVTEETPRSTPRVPTHLHARCRRDGREWGCSVLSLSENGCLVRSPEPLMLGARVEISFSLPRSGALSLEAETAYQLVPDVGMIFHAIPARQREAIADFVTATLAA